MIFLIPSLFSCLMACNSDNKSNAEEETDITNEVGDEDTSDDRTNEEDDSSAFETVPEDHIELGQGQIIAFESIPAGTFLMGSPISEEGRVGNEDLHDVTLTRDFLVSTSEITQGMYFQLMGYQVHDGYSADCGEGTDYPAYYVSWHMAADFSNKLTQKYNSLYERNLQECYSCSASATPSVTCSTAIQPIYDCSGYRMLTEAEWEYSARSGTTQAFWTSNGGGDLPIESTSTTSILSDGFDLTTVAWYYPTVGTPYGAKEVANLLPNHYGLYDMIGNLGEWTHDAYQENLGMDPVIDPVWEMASARVLRNDGWSGYPDDIRSARRRSKDPYERSAIIGFRIGKTIH